MEGGRRGVKHEYPQRDVPFIEDLGRKARVFPVEAFVVGEDYFAARDALIAALETPGAGELIHPYYGTRRVICTSFRMREGKDLGGAARFGITFEETESAPQYPISVPAAGDRVEASADVATAEMEQGFLDAYDVDGQPSLALKSLSNVMESGVEAMQEAFAPLMTAEQDMAALTKATSDFIDDVSSIVREPAEIISGLEGIVSSMVDLAGDARLAVSALLEAYGFTPSADRPPATTATREQEQGNYDALLAFMRLLCVLQAARTATSVSFETRDEAIETRDAICDAIDDQEEVVADSVYGALRDLRVDLMRAIPGEETDLPFLMAYRPPAQMPSLVITHRLYGDLSREADLLARNKILRPGFISANAELEVLSDA